MAPRKGLSPFSHVISNDLNSLERYWYLLTSSLCSISLCQYLRKNVVVQSFPKEFEMVERATLWQVNECMFNTNVVPDFVVVASSFGILAVLFWQQIQKSSLLKDPRFGVLRTFLNNLDFGALPCQHEEITRGTPFADPATIPSRNQPQPHVAHKLSLNSSPVNVEDAPPMTPKQSGQNGKQSISPDIKDIGQDLEINSPEKELLIKKGGSN